MGFSKRNFIIFLILFLTECGIALCFESGFIRHTFGDFLVVIMMYYFFRSWSHWTPMTTAIVVLVIAYTVEFLQLTPFLEYINLEDNQLAKLVFGSTFHFSDLIAYTLGILTVLIIENNNYERLKVTL